MTANGKKRNKNKNEMKSICLPLSGGIQHNYKLSNINLYPQKGLRMNNRDRLNFVNRANSN